MKKWLNVFLALVMSVMCCTTMGWSADAAQLPEVSLPVSVSLSGTLPNPTENFSVVLKSSDMSYPMPEGAEGGVYTMTITGEDRESIPAIVYSRVGLYTYTVYQVPGSNERCSYDDVVYNLVVTVSNKTDYSGLEATAVLYPEEEGDKMSGVEFHNEYQVEDAVKPDTGDTSSLPLYTVLLLASVGGLWGMYLVGKRKNASR